MKNLIDPNFQFIDECEAIADYIEEHLYDTVAWQLPNPMSPYDTEPEWGEETDGYNEIHAKAMEQVVAIIATRFFLQD